MEIFVNDAANDVKNYQEAIQLSGGKLAEAGMIDPQYIDACIDRETDFPTGLLLADGEGIAMPHGNSDLVKKDSLSVVRAEDPIEFGRMEDKDQKVNCSLIFNLALASGQQHLSILRKLIGLFQDEAFVKTRQTASKEEVQSFIANQLAE